jgi:uncharacterized membrane protein
LGIITGLLFFVIEEENQFVRFHAAQSIVVFGAFFVFNIVLSILTRILVGVSGVYLLLDLLSLLMNLVGLVAWIGLMYKAYNGEMFRVPVAADIADNLL